VQTSIHDFTRFLVKLCHQLMGSGCSSNRVETLAQRLGATYGFEVEALAIPTGVWLAIRSSDTQLVELTRIQSWSVDLDRLARLNDLVDAIINHNLDLAEGQKLLKNVETCPAPYNMPMTLIAGGFASMTLMFSLGSATVGWLMAFPLGVATQVLNKYFLVGENRRFLSDFLAAAFVGLYAHAAKLVVPAISPQQLIIAGIIGMVPGLTLVNAIHELAQKNLVSGSAKLVEAFLIGTSLTFGVATAVAIMEVVAKWL
jgi:uncharacterized membrane protein YjjP (DUF1212 family)